MSASSGKGYRPLDEYGSAYSCIAMGREEGILELRVHSDGGSLQWGVEPHHQLASAFLDVGNDPENEVVIFTGTGELFTGPYPERGWKPAGNTRDWAHLHWEGRRLQMNLLQIEVPVIAAVNGPAYRHSELPLLSDIVLASPTATFGDPAHFVSGLVPGDGINLVYQLLLGPNRARYLALTGKLFTAVEAERWGVVGEIVESDQLLDRAWELARTIKQQTRLVRRYTRLTMTQEIRTRMEQHVGYGLALEGLALCEPEQ